MSRASGGRLFASRPVLSGRATPKLFRAALSVIWRPPSRRRASRRGSAQALHDVGRLLERIGCPERLDCCANDARPCRIVTGANASLQRLQFARNRGCIGLHHGCIVAVFEQKKCRFVLGYAAGRRAEAVRANAAANSRPSARASAAVTPYRASSTATVSISDNSSMSLPRTAFSAARWSRRARRSDS